MVMKAHRQKERAALELPELVLVLTELVLVLTELVLVLTELVLVLPLFIFALVHYPLQCLSTIKKANATFPEGSFLREHAYV